MEVTQISARIDAGDKREKGATLARLDVSATDAISAQWSYLTQAQTLPSFMRGLGSVSSDASETTASAEQPESLSGAGLVLTLAREKGLSAGVEAVDYNELRDLAFEELVVEGIYHAQPHRSARSKRYGAPAASGVPHVSIPDK